MSSPANSQTNDEGSRWYIHPLTQERFVSVTTALQAVSKAALIPWAANLAAAAALDQLPRLARAAITPGCGKHTTDDKCGDCYECMYRWIARRHYFESNRGRERGSAVHKVQEWWALHGTLPDYDRAYEPWIKAFRKFTLAYKPDVFLTETTVLSREHLYAGTLDLGLTIKADTCRATEDLCSRFGKDSVNLYVDAKTTRKVDNSFYPDWALQLAGYRHAEMVMLPDGTEEKLPTVDGAAVLLLRSDGEFCLRPVVADEMTFAAFLCALNLFRWQTEYGALSTQVQAFPAPKTRALKSVPPPAKKAAARKAAPRSRVDQSAPMRPVSEVAAEQSAALRSMTTKHDPFEVADPGDTKIPF